MKKLAITLAVAGIATATASTALANEITVAHYKRGFMGAPYAVAMAKGYFKEAGIDIARINGSRGGGTTVRNVLASKFPFGEVSLPAAYFAWRKGAPIRIVSSCCSVTGDMLFIAKKGAKINSIKDLVGKKVGFTNPKGGSEMFLKMSLQKAGIPFDKVNMVSTGGFGAGVSALASGGIDVAFMAEPVWSLRRMQRKFKPVFWVKDYAPRTSGVVGITTVQFAKNNGDKIRAILKARAKAVAFIKSNPEEAGKIIAKVYKMPPAPVVAMIKRNVGLNYWSDGAFDKPGMQAMMDGMKLIKVLPANAKVEWDKILDGSYLPK